MKQDGEGSLRGPALRSPASGPVNLGLRAFLSCSNSSVPGILGVYDRDKMVALLFHLAFNIISLCNRTYVQVARYGRICDLRRALVSLAFENGIWSMKIPPKPVSVFTFAF